MKYLVGYTADSGGREALALGRLLAQVSGVDLNRMHNARKIGLFPATMLVAGNMIGAGIFMMPTIIASIGGIATLGWLVMVVGAKNKSVSLSASEPREKVLLREVTVGGGLVRRVVRAIAALFRPKASLVAKKEPER